MRQAAVGLGLAAGIVTAWLSLHVYGVFFHRWEAIDLIRAPVIVALQAWLGTGMFIVAHDAIHGSLAPGRPRVNRAVGQICVGLYAGFSFRRLAEKHRQHHATPGAETDPDFYAPSPSAMPPWFLAFFRRYFGLREFAIVTVVLAIYLLGFRASPINAAVFWGLPAILSALQLFTFGTYLPHRHEAQPFADHHRARTLDYPWLASLLACFHFGRHHQHHLSPATPWWRLPQV